ncbi:hypothetical protein TrCOL_g9158 [Triparma columacea]|uniref:RNA helicase n=1 Tax=Triparma columacea TaxID=722753 RepID=A0A9W7GQK0_9STRA|nr:hypothetical protein TrCOL_g9158 [Triparma columacea]
MSGFQGRGRGGRGRGGGRAGRGGGAGGRGGRGGYGGQNNFGGTPGGPPRSREDRKAGRRAMQQRKEAQKGADEARYFFDQVRQLAGRRPPRKIKSERELFGTQGTAGINFKEYTEIKVSRSGGPPNCNDIPKLASFTALKGVLPEYLFSNLTLPTRMNYDQPTPIQQHTVSLGLHGLDIMACAQTGSGKTCAFLVPLLTSIYNAGFQGKEMPPHTTPCLPSALVLAPTRELAMQIELESQKLMFGSPARCACVYGGASARTQLQECASAPDIIVATPGRLTDFLEREPPLIDLSYTRFLVLDEADRMLDMGFEPQLRRIVQNSTLPRDRQTLMFSATFADNVQKVAQSYLKPDYVFVSVGRIGSTTKNITQTLVEVGEHACDKRSKFNIVLQQNIITKGERTIVFTQKKATAQWLKKELRKAGYGEVEDIHGDRSQSQRESALASFRSGRCGILVATDVAARGLDVDGIRAVVQFDLPVSKENQDDYVHRIGRTGRAGNTGRATGLFVRGYDPKNGNEVLAPFLRKLLTESKQVVPEFLKGAGGGGGAGGRNGRQPQKDTCSTTATGYKHKP